MLSSAKACGLDVPNSGAPSDGDAELEDWELMPRLLLFSTKNPKALHKSIQDHEAYLTSHSDSLRDMSFNLALKRDHLPYRAFCVADGIDDLVPVISRRPVFSGSRRPPNVVFMFTGQGAQWATMGQALMRTAEYREALESLDSFLRTLDDGPAWSLLGMQVPKVDFHTSFVLFRVFQWF